MRLHDGRRQILAHQCGFFGTPRGLGLATATTSATFIAHSEHRIRAARAANVAARPAIRASASGSMCRDAPQGQVTRTRKSPRQSWNFVCEAVRAPADGADMHA
jgi:hypothetical protein